MNAMMKEHPLKYDEGKLDDDLEETMQLILGMNNDELSSHRRGITKWVVERGRQLRENGAVERWLETVDPACRPVVNTINGPLLEELMDIAGYDNPEVMRQLREGVAMTGKLPGAMRSAEVDVEGKVLKTIDELWAERKQRNKELIKSLRQDPYEDELMKQILEEAEEGKVSMPWKVKDEDADGTLLSHRFSRVQGFKKDGSPKVRAIDNGTKSGVYDAAVMTRKLQMGSIDELMTIFKRRYRNRPGKYVAMKADIKAAFRRNPVRKQDRWMTTAAFKYRGDVWATQHAATPFGFLASVPGWDLLGEPIQMICVKLLIMVLLRYVDDYFTAEAEELADEAAKCVKMVVEAILGEGAVPDDKCLAANPLVVLGVEVKVDGAKV